MSGNFKRFHRVCGELNAKVLGVYTALSNRKLCADRTFDISKRKAARFSPKPNCWHTQSPSPRTCTNVDDGVLGELRKVDDSQASLRNGNSQCGLDCAISRLIKHSRTTLPRTSMYDIFRVGL